MPYKSLYLYNIRKSIAMIKLTSLGCLPQLYKMVCVLSLLGLFTSDLISQSSIEIDNVILNPISGDSASIELTYNLTLPTGAIAKVSLQRKTENNPNYYQSLEGAVGEIGEEITAGTNKVITWQGPNEGSFYNLTLFVSQSPEVEVISELVNQIDSNQMRQDLELIEGVRHRTAGVDQLGMTQDMIKDRMDTYDLEVLEQSFPFNSTYNGLNIIGTQSGCGQDENVWLIGGHYDTVEGSPGADDNGSAVVGMLEAARVLSQYQFEKRIAFVAWDLEEEGLLGSIDFVSNNKDSFGEMEGYLNFEMIGYYSDRPNSQTFPSGFGQLFPAQQQAVEDDDNRGNFITNVGNTQNSMALMQSFEAAANVYVPDLKVLSVAAPGTGEIVPDLRRSDHTPFWVADIPALMLTDGANFRNENYHGPEDVLDSLDFTFMSNVVKASVATIVQDAVPTICLSDDFFTTVSLGTNTIVHSKNIKVSPNPTMDFINVSTTELILDIDSQWAIYNNSGMLLKEGALNLTTRIDCASMQSGLYHLVIVGEDSAYSANFIIQR